MTNLSPLDRALEEILTDFASVVRLMTLHPQTEGEVQDPIEAIKQAVSEYVIGGDDIPEAPMHTDPLFVKHRNELRTEQRALLRGGK